MVGHNKGMEVRTLGGLRGSFSCKLISNLHELYGSKEAASSLAGTAVKLHNASAALLQCVADSWGDVLGSHRAELSKGTRDEDWGAQAGGWTLVDVLTPPKGAA